MQPTAPRADRQLFWVLLLVGLAVNLAYALAVWAQRPDVLTPQFGLLLYWFLLLTWVNREAQRRPEIFRPYDFGLILFLFWYLYLPYYFLRTRGARGLALLLGLVALPYFAFIVLATMNELARLGVIPP